MEELLKKYSIETKYLQQDKLVVCVFTLKSGFIITGKSMPINKKDFKLDLGKKYAFEEAMSELIIFDDFFEKELKLNRKKILKNNILALETLFFNELKNIDDEKSKSIIQNLINKIKKVNK